MDTLENLIFVTLTSLSLYVIVFKYLIIISLLSHFNKLGYPYIKIIPPLSILTAAKTKLSLISKAFIFCKVSNNFISWPASSANNSSLSNFFNNFISLIKD